MKKVLAIMIAALFYSCKNQDEIVVSHQWKYGGGYHIGDWIEIGNRPSKIGLYLSNDTIYREGAAVALVEKIEYPYFEHYDLYITSLSKNEKGLYIGKGTKE